MVLTEDAAAGSTILEIDAITCGLQVETTLVVNAGNANEEFVTVAGFGSILLESALVVRHPSPPHHHHHHHLTLSTSNLHIARPCLPTSVAPCPTTQLALTTQRRPSPTNPLATEQALRG